MKLWSSRRNSPADTAPEVKADSVSALQREIKARLAMLCAVLIVGSIAGIAFFSTAWFVNTDKVTASNINASISADDASLFIRQKNALPDYKSSVTIHRDTALYPISTPDCASWFYVSQWTPVRDHMLASGYTEIDSFLDEAAGTYTNDFEGLDLCAYYRADFTLYTNHDALDVYLDPEDPLTVTYTATPGKQVDSAVRIALVSGDQVLFVYAPKAETAVGNSIDTDAVSQTAGGFYCVDDGALSEIPYTLYVGTAQLAAHTAVKAFDGIHTDYVPQNGSLLLCTATQTGTDLSLYVWLEGTDGETLIGSSDAETSPLSVSLRMVGASN